MELKREFLSRPSNSLWIRFLRFNISSNKRLQVGLEKIGLTPPQYYVLATLGYSGGLPFGEIGAKMMVTVSNLTGIVDRLEDKKLVVRERDKQDRRVIHVKLTDKGMKTYKTGITAFEKSVARVFSPLDESEQKQLMHLLRKLLHGPKSSSN